jgi:hypothetical protein
MIPVAPELVQEVFWAVLSDKEARPLGGGRIMPLRSDWNQDFRGVRHELARSFRDFLLREGLS